MSRAPFLLLIAVGLLCPSSAVGQPSSRPSRPLVILDLDPAGTSAVGFPAVAADGASVALVESASDLSGAASFGVSFVRVSDGATILEVPITAVDQDGRARRLPATHGRTAWARARFVNAELARGGYRPLAQLKQIGEQPRWAGAGMRARYDERNGKLAILGARGVVRARLGRRQVSCGMELEPGRVVRRPAEVIAVHGDAATGVALLTYGLRYASCMCNDDVAHLPARLSR